MQPLDWGLTAVASPRLSSRQIDTQTAQTAPSSTKARPVPQLVGPDWGMLSGGCSCHWQAHPICRMFGSSILLGTHSSAGGTSQRLSLAAVSFCDHILQQRGVCHGNVGPTGRRLPLANTYRFTAASGSALSHENCLLWLRSAGTQHAHRREEGQRCVWGLATGGFLGQCQTMLYLAGCQSRGLARMTAVMSGDRGASGGTRQTFYHSGSSDCATECSIHLSFGRWSG